MKISNVDIEQLTQTYMQHTQGPCVSVYVTPQVKQYLANQGISSSLYKLFVMRFRTEQEAVAKYNELIRIKPTLWINGVRS